MTRRERLLHRGRLVLDLALGLVLAGLADLAITAWIEYLRHPGLSFAAAYQLGREPWTSIGIGAVIGGALATLLVGAGLALIEGSWIRRLLALAALAAGGTWWLTALGVLPYHRFRGPDPVGFAFTMPEETAVALLLPAVLASLIVLAPRRVRPSSRMAPVHPEDQRR